MATRDRSGDAIDPDSGDDAIDPDPVTQALLDLEEHVAAAEAVDWTLVPGISVAEAGAWTQKCENAREKLAGETGGVSDGE